MAASSASADCLDNTEVLGWFKDADKSSKVYLMFVNAQAATQRNPAEWARENWATACKGMRVLMQNSNLSSTPDVAFSTICGILENHIQGLEDAPKEKGRGGKRKNVVEKERGVKRKPDELQPLAAEPRTHVEVVCASAVNASGLPVVAAAMPNSSAIHGARKRKPRTKPDEFLAKVNAFHQFLVRTLQHSDEPMRVKALNKLYRDMTGTLLHNMPTLWKSTHTMWPDVFACSTCATAGNSITTKAGTVLTYRGSVTICGTTLNLYSDTSSSTSKDKGDSGDADNDDFTNEDNNEDNDANARALSSEGASVQSDQAETQNKSTVLPAITSVDGGGMDIDSEQSQTLNLYSGTDGTSNHNGDSSEPGDGEMEVDKANKDNDENDENSSLLMDTGSPCPENRTGSPPPGDVRTGSPPPGDELFDADSNDSTTVAGMLRPGKSDKSLTNGTTQGVGGVQSQQSRGNVVTGSVEPGGDMPLADAKGGEIDIDPEQAGTRNKSNQWPANKSVEGREMDIDSEQSQGKCVHLDDGMMTAEIDRLMESQPGDKTCKICSMQSTTLWNCATCNNLMCDFWQSSAADTHMISSKQLRLSLATCNPQHGTSRSVSAVRQWKNTTPLSYPVLRWWLGQLSRACLRTMMPRRSDSCGTM